MTPCSGDTNHVHVHCDFTVTLVRPNQEVKYVSSETKLCLWQGSIMPKIGCMTPAPLEYIHNSLYAKSMLPFNKTGSDSVIMCGLVNQIHRYKRYELEDGGHVSLPTAIIVQTKTFVLFVNWRDHNIFKWKQCMCVYHKLYSTLYRLGRRLCWWTFKSPMLTLAWWSDLFRHGVHSESQRNYFSELRNYLGEIWVV